MHRREINADDFKPAAALLNPPSTNTHTSAHKQRCSNSNRILFSSCSLKEEAHKVYWPRVPSPLTPPPSPLTPPPGCMWVSSTRVIFLSRICSFHGTLHLMLRVAVVAAVVVLVSSLNAVYPRLNQVFSGLTPAQFQFCFSADSTTHNHHITARERLSLFNATTLLPALRLTLSDNILNIFLNLFVNIFYSARKFFTFSECLWWSTQPRRSTAAETISCIAPHHKQLQQ